MKEKRRNRSFFNFKTIFRLSLLVYWSSVFFVSPRLLYAVIPYAVFRLIAAMNEFEDYDEWKRMRYGKSDQKLTVRKLFYILKKADKLETNRAMIQLYRNNSFHYGQFRVDEHILIKLKSGPSRYTATLFFDGELVSSFEGYTFQGVKWDLDDVPELKKTLTKFIYNIEEFFEKEKRAEKNRLNQLTKQQNEKEENERALLVRKIRQTYKKDMSI